MRGWEIRNRWSFDIFCEACTAVLNSDFYWHNALEGTNASHGRTTGVGAGESIYLSRLHTRTDIHPLVGVVSLLFHIDFDAVKRT